MDEKCSAPNETTDDKVLAARFIFCFHHKLTEALVGLSINLKRGNEFVTNHIAPSYYRDPVKTIINTQLPHA